MIYLNGQPINVTMFPDQTSQVWKIPTLDIPDTNFVHVKWKFEYEGEFMHLAQLKFLIEKYGYKSTLRLPYLPYARQDKEVSNSSTFALTAFANLLNVLKFDEVLITDPHSPVALDRIVNSRAIYPTDHIYEIYKILNYPLVCYPDSGAGEKYDLMLGLSSIFGKKQRDPLTGAIIKYELIGDPNNKDILIIDDICDGGATFILLAKELYTKGAQSVNLFVSHGIFSRGLRPLKESGIKRIFTIKGEVSEHQQQICYRTL